MDYFHLDYRSVLFLVGRLQRRLHQSTSPSLRARFSQWDRDLHGEPAIAVVAKIEMAEPCFGVPNTDRAQLVAYLSSVPDAVEECIRGQRALDLPDRDLL